MKPLWEQVRTAEIAARKQRGNYFRRVRAAYVREYKRKYGKPTHCQGSKIWEVYRLGILPAAFPLPAIAISVDLQNAVAARYICKSWYGVVYHDEMELI